MNIKKKKKKGISPPTNYFLHELCTLGYDFFFRIFLIYNENELLIKQCITNIEKRRNNKTEK